MTDLAARISRLGTESAFEVLARVKALEDQGQDIINLGIGQPDFKTPDHIVEAATKALRDGHHGYTPAAGIAELRQAVSADIDKRRGVTVDPGDVMIVPGGKVTMFFAILMFGEAGAEILYPNPGFPIYESAINFTGAKAVPMPLYEDTGFSFNADEVLGLITPKTRLLILNSHGGNELKSVLRELVGGPVHLFLCDWFRSISADVQADLFTEPGDHAGEMETALALAYFPDLVARDPDTGRLAADEGSVRSTRFAAVNRGWISITRPWHLLTSNSGVGNPHPATAEAGQKLMQALVERLSSFLVELADADVDETFPYPPL